MVYVVLFAFFVVASFLIKRQAGLSLFQSYKEANWSHLRGFCVVIMLPVCMATVVTLAWIMVVG